MKNKKELVFWILGGGIAALCLVILAIAPAYSDTTDTPSGTIITAEAAECTLDYQDTGGIDKTTVNPASDIETTVAPIYGLSGIGAPADQNSSGSTDPQYFLYTVTNEGNASDTYALAIDSTSYGGPGSPSGWTIEVVESGNDNVISTLLIGEDGTGQFRIKVTPIGTATDGQYVDVTAKASTAQTPVGEYTGSNGLTYGGSSEASHTARTTISGAPLLTLTRVSTVDAPSAFSGDAHAHVPGAVITYTYTYSNTGSGSAESNVIVDKIPTNTQAVQVNTTEVSNVSITASQGDATGWTVATSEVNSPQSGFRDYGSTEGWTVIGTISSTADYATNSGGTGGFTKGIGTGTTYLRFEKSSIATDEDTKKLMWGVTIK